MDYHVDLDKAIVNRGNLYRLKNLMKRAQNGEKLTVGFIGGSITQGALSSRPQTCYAYRVYAWWKQKFPMAKFVYLNAGIGGTTSQFGVARVETDLLVHKPDFVIIEFSVNDENNVHFLETYEGLVRKIIYDLNEPAILILNNVHYNDGRNAQEQHNLIGREYQIPCVSMKNSIYPFVAAGVITNKEITPDDLHPNDLGHELIADIVIHFLEKVYQDLDQEEVPVTIIEAPITRNTYQNSVRYQNNSTNYLSDGFTKDTSTQESITQFFKNGWIADKEGASIVFDVEGTAIAVQFRKSIKKPTPIAAVVVDDEIENSVTLDGNFDEDWGDCLYLQTVSENLEKRVHKVEIHITDVHKNDVVPFYLVSVIGTY